MGQKKVKYKFAPFSHDGGAGGAGGAAAAIPEPSTLMLCLTALLGLGFCRRRRRKR